MARCEQHGSSCGDTHVQQNVTCVFVAAMEENKVLK